MEYLPSLAKLYLQKNRKETLKWFGETEGTFLVTIGGDSCPFQKHESTCSFLISSLDVGTVLCKSNANNNQQISCLVLAIYRRYISETSHGLRNVTTINQRDIGKISPISRQDIVLARLRCNNISQSKTIYRCSEVCCNDMS